MTDAEKKGRGRPRHEPQQKDRDIVEALAGFAIPHFKIAHVIRISEATLRLHYATELERGASVVEANLVSNLLRLAKGTDGTALKAIMFSLQCRFGWSQYAPPPVEKPPEEKLGKKELANREAQTAHEDTEWGSLLN